MAQLNQESLSRNVRRHKQKARKEPEIPDDNSFEIPEQYRLTFNGEHFLIHDNEEPESRIIIFAAEWALDLLEESTHWGVSVTFFELNNIYL